MSYSWQKYLDFSNELLGSSTGIDDETRYRTISSRSYYAAFNIATDWLLANTSFKRKTQDVHKVVFNEYEQIGQLKSSAKDIAANLEILRIKRVKADYYADNPSIWTKTNAQFILFSAKTTINDINKLTA